MALFIISVLQIWFYTEIKGGAIRILQERAAVEEKRRQTMESTKSETEIFRRYFSGRVSSRNGRFFDSQRKIPNCPDPLHNK